MDGPLRRARRGAAAAHEDLESVRVVGLKQELEIFLLDQFDAAKHVRGRLEVVIELVACKQ